MATEPERRLSDYERRMLAERQAREQLDVAKRARRIEGYRNLLDSPLWERFRTSIVAERGAMCERCEASGVQLQAHHKWYLPGRLPWDYPDSVLARTSRR